MRPVRKFWLRNAIGDEIDLNGAANIWATDPTGLGVELSPSYANLTSGFFTVLSDEFEPQVPVGMTLVFTRRGSVYDDYHGLAGWIAAAGSGLLLLYQPPGGEIYYRQVQLQYLKRGETDRTGWLSCQASFQPTTPWYLPTPVTADIGQESSDAMRYSWRYDVSRYAESNAASYAAILEPLGDLPAPLRLRFAGTATNPTITLVGLSTGTQYGRAEISTTLISGDVLEWSSAVQDSYLRLIRSGSVISLDNYLDPAQDPFFRLPLAEPCKLVISGDAISGEATVSVSYLFRSV